MNSLENTISLPTVTDLIFLRPASTRSELERACAELRETGGRGICLGGSLVALARHYIEDSEAKVIAVVGFPWGGNDSDAKRYEVEAAVDADAHELEVVINLGWIKDGELARAERELRDVIEAADERPVRAVLETSLLAREQIATAIQVALNAGVDGIQTSTGVSNTAVALEEIRFIRDCIGQKKSLKIAGGIRSQQMARTFLEAGASLLGTGNLAALLAPPPLPDETSN